MDRRGNFTFTPALTFQLYAEPLMSLGRYLTFKRVTDPAASSGAGRFDHLGEDRLIQNGASVGADFNRDGGAPLGVSPGVHGVSGVATGTGIVPSGQSHQTAGDSRRSVWGAGDEQPDTQGEPLDLGKVTGCWMLDAGCWWVSP